MSMNMYPVSAAASRANDSTTASSGASSTATDYQSMFMQLLATELQSQDPTQTIDPTTMVTQMVEINQLSDVSGIYSILQDASGVAANTSSVAHSASAGNPIPATAPQAASPVSSTTAHSAQNTLGGN